MADLAARNAGRPGQWDFWPMLQSIEPWVSAADFSICHLEGTLSPDDTGLSYYPRFVAPNELADALVRAGWDACSTASNHALDAGEAGITATLDELDARGIGHSGTARTPAEQLPSLYEVNGVTIAHLSFSQHFNGLEPPPERPWVVNRLDVDRILSDARWARDHGAEFVVVSLHWGVEYVTNPLGYQRDIAEALLSDPAVDLILGHHPHVVEPIGMVGDKYVAYSMGNHVSNQHVRWGPDYFGTNEGQLLFIHVADDESGHPTVTGIDVVPTWVTFDDLQVHAMQDAFRTGAIPEATARAALDRTMERTLRLGATGVRLAPDPWPEISCLGRRATVLGSPKDDTLVGTEGDDVIVGRSGNDVVDAGPGDDLVCAGAGEDVVDAGSGFDLVFGGPGEDTLVGSDGLDLLFGDGGSDSCSGISIVVGCERP